MSTNVRLVKRNATFHRKRASTLPAPLSVSTFSNVSVNVRTDLGIKRESISALVSKKENFFLRASLFLLFFAIIISI